VSFLEIGFNPAISSLLAFIVLVDDEQKDETHRVLELGYDGSHFFGTLELSCRFEAGKREIGDGWIGYAMVHQWWPGSLPDQREDVKNVIGNDLKIRR
jgi:hypothetical protein